MPHQADDGRRIEEPGVVLDPAAEAGRLVPEVDHEVELGGAVVERHAGHGDAAGGERRRGGAAAGGERHLRGEHHLEERRVGEVALRLHLLDQLLERQVLVREGAHHGVARPGEQAVHVGVAAEVGAQHQGVDEEADQPLELDPGAAGGRRADQQVVLAGVAMEQRRQAGELRHEHGDPGALGEVLEADGDLSGQLEVVARAVPGPHLGPRPVGGQLEHCGGAVQALLPVGELGAQGAAQPLPLPVGVVGVLDRQLGELPGPPFGERAVDRGELAVQDAGGPAVADDVVHVEHHQVIRGVQPQHQAADQRPGREVEGALDLARRDAADLGGHAGGGQAGEVDDRQRHPEVPEHHLQRPPFDRREGGAQRLVAPHHLVEALLHLRRVERAGEAVGRVVVVERPGLRAGRGTRGAPARTRAGTSPDPVAGGSRPPRRLRRTCVAGARAGRPAARG